MNASPGENPGDDRRRWAPLVLIIALLIAWGGLLAWGAVRAQANFDLRKPAIILGAVTLFVLFWLGLLVTRARRH